eukprot:361409-Amphidinium_carterae.1
MHLTRFLRARFYKPSLICLGAKASDGFDPVSGTSSRTPSAGAESIHGTGSHTDLMVEDLQAWRDMHQCACGIHWRHYVM